MGRRLLGLTLVVSLVVAASLAYRVRKAKPMFLPSADAVRFIETWRWGRSDRRFSSRLAQAPGLLWIIVTGNRLRVSPHFPFSLAFVAEVFGWDHDLPGKSIVNVQVDPSAGATALVSIQYRHLTGEVEILELAVGDRQAFLAALAQIRGQ